MGESNPPASSMKLEARTPVLALKEMAEEHAADGNANLAEGTGRERVVGAPKAAHHRACRCCELLGKLNITCQRPVEGEQLPRPVESLRKGIKRYLAVCHSGKPWRGVCGQGSQWRA